jgi:hypothetical protein
MIKVIAAASAMFAITATTTLEAAVPLLQPVPYGSAVLRHHQGQPSIELHGRHGAIEVTPLPMDHGCVNFGITVFNRSDRAADIDLANVTAFVGDAPAEILTVAALQKRANNRAFWTSMAVAAMSGLAAGMVAASTSHTTIRTSGPYGMHTTKIRYHDGANSANATMIGASGVAAAGSIQDKGAREAAQMGDEILGLTTVDPGDAYGGRVVIDKIKGPLPQTIMLSVEWNGEVYASKWQLVPEGTPAPAFSAAPVADMPSVPQPAKLEPALLTVERQGPVAATSIRPIAAKQPQQYPHDDTVQVPM